MKNAPFGAKGDGVADDTSSIQRAVDSVAGTGGTVSIPKGIYRVNALTSIRLKSDMTLSMSHDAVLKAIPNGSAHYAILLVSDANSVNILGGTLEGERSKHTGKGGEWGHGLNLKNAKKVVVEGVTVKDCWGDGFYVSASAQVTFCKVSADHNRRQGLSITSVDGLVVRNSTFKNTTGTLPEDGIDIEPNPGESVNNVLITGCTVSQNSGFGIEVGVPIAYTGKASITHVVIDRNTCTGNGINSLSTSPRAGIEASNTSGHQITNNTSTENGLGILLRNNANHFTVRGNTVAGNAGAGIQQYLCNGNTIVGNSVSRNAGKGIDSPSCTGGSVEGNKVDGNGGGP